MTLWEQLEGTKTVKLKTMSLNTDYSCINNEAAKIVCAMGLFYNDITNFFFFLKSCMRCNHSATSTLPMLAELNNLTWNMVFWGL